MAKRVGYYPKATAPGIWNVFKEDGALVTEIGVGFNRAKARRMVFLLNTGKIKTGKSCYYRGMPDH